MFCLLWGFRGGQGGQERGSLKSHTGSVRMQPEAGPSDMVLLLKQAGREPTREHRYPAPRRAPCTQAGKNAMRHATTLAWPRGYDPMILS